MSKTYSMVRSVFGVVEVLPPGVEAAADPGLEYGDSSVGCSKSRRLDIVRQLAGSFGCWNTPSSDPDCLMTECKDTEQAWSLVVFCTLKKV